MLADIEDKLIELLQEKIEGIPKENIAADAKPSKPPAIRISSLKFKFKNADMAENADAGKVDLRENFSSDGTKTSYILKEKPLKDSVQVETPPGTLLTEKDFTVNYKDGSINFRKAPAKGKNNILVNYNSQKRVITLKTIKLKALFAFDVFGKDKNQSDSLAEKLVKTLLAVEDQLVAEGIEMRPLGGASSTEENGNQKIRLRYLVEKEMRVEQIVGPIEKIEITRKNI
jgi:hypothetical protein